MEGDDRTVRKLFIDSLVECVSEDELEMGGAFRNGWNNLEVV